MVGERDRLGARDVQLRARPSSPVFDHALGWIDAHEARLRPALMRGAQQPSCTAADVEDRGGVAEARGEIERVAMDAIEVQGLPLRALITLRPAVELRDVILVRGRSGDGPLPGHRQHRTARRLRRAAVGQ